MNAQSIIGTDYRLQPTAESDITASSELGPDLNGTVELNTLDVDLTKGLLELSETFSDSEDNVVASCQDLSDTNSLIVSGRGGVPAGSGQILNAASTWVDFRGIEENRQLETSQSEIETSYPVSAQPAISQPAISPSIVEAQSVAMVDGKVTLLASGAQPQLTSSTLCQA